MKWLVMCVVLVLAGCQTSGDPSLKCNTYLDESGAARTSCS
ncbi:hypothetical protein EV286_101334 [Rhizobium sp. BK251]|nr:hypothetical protein EV286_101334 [Rhizobium sp. BK251]